MPHNRRPTSLTLFLAAIALAGSPAFTSAAEPPAATSTGIAPAVVSPVTAAPAAPTAPLAPSQIETDYHARLPRDTFEVQVALMRDACCPGSIDGALGGQTRAAIAAFQKKHDLAPTGQLDASTREALRLTVAPLKYYTVTDDDITRLRPAAKTWIERSKLDRLDYTSVLELVAERNFAHPGQIKKLNPGVVWEQVVAGTTLVVPNVFRSSPKARAETIAISLSAKTLELLDIDGRVLAHFPCSIAKKVEKRPVGVLEVTSLSAKNPNYTFNPEVFPESPEAQLIDHKLIIQPGPNNPVGVAWIGLSLSGYGIHGSPEPEQIGRTESHGCFRLANWNAEFLFPLVRAGMPVQVDP